MRTLIKVVVPAEAGNKAIKDGTLPATINNFLEKQKPEAAYFATDGGDRTAFFVVDVGDPSDIPSIAEPFFTNMHARITFSPVMNAQDLARGLAKLPR